MKTKKKYFIILLLIIGIACKFYIDYSNDEVTKTCNYNKVSDDNVFLKHTSPKLNLKFYKENIDSDIMLSVLEISKPLGIYKECKNYNVTEVLEKDRKFEFNLDDGEFKLKIGLIQGDIKLKTDNILFSTKLIKDKFSNDYTSWYASQSIDISEYLIN